jgi:LysM repeat protein
MVAEKFVFCDNKPNDKVRIEEWAMGRLGCWIAVMILMGLGAWGTGAQDQTVAGEPVIHTVTYGDTLYRIAQRYGVSIDEIAQANGIVQTWSIKIGQELAIPGLTVPDDSDSVNNPLVAGTPVEHTIRAGETLNTIAQRYGVTIDSILRANQIANPNYIYAGQKLKIWSAVPQTTTATSTGTASAGVGSTDVPYTHIVRSGETLGTIARRYGVTLGQIVAANAISNPDRVLVGQVVVIPGRTAPQTSGTNPDVLASASAPAATVTSGKQIVVDLSDQRVYAFENGTLVFTAIVSTGLPATPTVLGEFKIYHRLESQTMSGPGYYLPGVQWVQYFYSGYALHGTYWHENFGQPMSHGCVNLRNEDALWLFRWASIGTPVRVQA